MAFNDQSFRIDPLSFEDKAWVLPEPSILVSTKHPPVLKRTKVHVKYPPAKDTVAKRITRINGHDI
jgi:hypothetical protein